jgi:hypothetical protein
VNCRRRDYSKAKNLDCCLRDRYARNPDTKQAVNEVIDALVATVEFEPGEFRCPDSGNLCKGIKVLV